MNINLMRHIKDLHHGMYAGKAFTQDDRLFLMSCLIEPQHSDITIAALMVFMESDQDMLEFLLAQYDQLTREAWHLAIPMLACTDYIRCYSLLLNVLKRSCDEEESYIIVSSLASTTYPITPIIVQELITDNAKYLMNLKLILKKMGLKKLTVFLAMSPHIPHEAVFREVFGGQKIDSIKQRK